ncbi:MAG: hypothetical protein V4568_05995 [Pseudomonadota bacterium]
MANIDEQEYSEPDIEIRSQSSGISEMSVYDVMELTPAEIERSLKEERQLRDEAIQENKDTALHDKDIFEYEILAQVKNYSPQKLQDRVGELVNALIKHQQEYNNPQQSIAAQERDKRQILEYKYATARQLFDDWPNKTYAGQNYLMYLFDSSRKGLTQSKDFIKEIRVETERDMLLRLIQIAPTDQTLSSYEKILLSAEDINRRIDHSKSKEAILPSEDEENEHIVKMRAEIQDDRNRWKLQRTIQGMSAEEQDRWIKEADSRLIEAETQERGSGKQIYDNPKFSTMYEEIMPRVILREWEGMSADQQTNKINGIVSNRQQDGKEVTLWDRVRNATWDEIVTAIAQEFTQEEYAGREQAVDSLTYRHSYEQSPGIEISAAPFPNREHSRNEQGALEQDMESARLDAEFWQRLHLHLTNAASEDKQMQVLLEEVQIRREIPKVKNDAQNTAHLQAITPLLQKIFTRIEPQAISHLDEYALSQLDYIADKAKVDRTDRYKLIKTGTFAAYEEQTSVDRADKFVARIKREILDPNSPYPILKSLRSPDGPSKLSTQEKNQLGTVLVELDNEECGISWTDLPPQVHRPQFGGVTPGQGLASTSIFDSVITSREGTFKTTALVYCVLAHEREHGHQNVLLEIAKHLPKEEKYLIKRTKFIPRSDTWYDHRHGRLAERKGYRQGMNVLIRVASDPALNGGYQGFLSKIDPRQSGGDILITVGKRLGQETGMQLPDMLRHDFLLKPFPLSTEGKGKGKGKATDSPTNVDEVMAAIHKFGKLCQDPWHPSIAMAQAFFSTMPAFVEKAFNPEDPMQKPCALIYEFIRNCGNKEELKKIPAFNPRLDSDEVSPNAILKILKKTAKNYPDDLSRRMLAEVAWLQIKDRTDLPADLTEKKVHQTVNLAERRFPLPQQRTSKAIADHVELELGVTMKELGAHFGLSDHSTTIGPKPAVEGLWRLETLRDYGKSSEELMDILGPRITPGFSAMLNDPAHPKYEQAQLLHATLSAGLEKSIYKGGPSTKKSMKKYFEEKYGFQFAVKPSSDKERERALALVQIAVRLPNKRCRDVLLETATDAINSSKLSKTDKVAAIAKVKSVVNSSLNKGSESGLATTRTKRKSLS